MNQSLLKTRNESCPFCDNKHSKRVYRTKNFELLECLHCSLIRTHLLSKVSSPSDEIYQDRTEALRQLYTQKEKFEDYAREIMDLVPITSGKLLDVGCGLGWVVKEANNRGFKATGIDSALHFVTVGKEFLQVPIKTCTFEDFKAKEKFDVIVFKHVLEHIKDLNSFLKKVKSLLTARGFIIVACPNINSLMFFVFKDRWYGLQAAQHIWQFTPKSIKKVFEQNGFISLAVVVRNLDYQVLGWKKILFKILIHLGNSFRKGDQLFVIARNPSQKEYGTVKLAEKV